MPKLAGFDQLARKIASRIQEARTANATSGVVGYTAAYAIFVHENLEAHHEVGQAKFLEQPARQNQRRYGEIIVQQAMKGRTLGQAILVACLQLQRDSQELCPVDKGFLRNSAFTRLDVSSNSPSAA